MITINGYEVAGRMPPFTRENRDLVRSGVKTQTRRVMKPQPEWPFYGPEVYTSCAVDRFGDMIPGKEVFGIYGDDWGLKCPYGRPGDIRVMCEPLNVAVDIAIATLGDLKVVLVDGIERLDEVHQTLMLGRLIDAGVQAFITKVSDSELTILTDTVDESEIPF